VTFFAKKVRKNPDILLDFDFTEEEFNLLEPSLYEDIIPMALHEERYELAYTVAKALGIRFPSGTNPKEILETLNSHLQGKSIVSCYIPEIELEHMLYYGLVPDPKVSLSGGTYSTILKLYKEGFSSEELKYWFDIEERIR
jgi:hypothetical protein